MDAEAVLEQLKVIPVERLKFDAHRTTLVGDMTSRTAPRSLGSSHRGGR